MHFRRFVLMSVFVLAFFTTILAQTAPTESTSDKEKKEKELQKTVLEMIDQAISDAGTLKLPQNRAIIYAIAGDLYWKYDEKRARDLFRNAGGEIIASNLESEKEKKDSDDPFIQIFDSTDVRNEVLPMIAKYDADLALELLVQTRPAKIAEALAKALEPNVKQESGYLSFNPEQARASGNCSRTKICGSRCRTKPRQSY